MATNYNYLAYLSYPIEMEGAPADYYKYDPTFNYVESVPFFANPFGGTYKDTHPEAYYSESYTTSGQDYSILDAIITNYTTSNPLIEVSILIIVSLLVIHAINKIRKLVNNSN